MNCDEVFQHLTCVSSAKPMNGQLAQHIASCPACRNMADLLCPATELFDRNSNEEEPGDAPEPWQRVWDAVAVAERAAAQLKDRQCVPSSRRNGTEQLLLSAALLLVGVTIGCVIGRGNVTDVVAGVSGNSPTLSSPTLTPDDPARGSCERLVAFLQRGGDVAFCPTCNRPIVGVQANICAICHTNWPSSSGSSAHVNSSL